MEGREYHMSAFVSEIIGTMLLILLGNGVVAGVVLRHSKAENAGWVVITFGWGFAVMIGVYAAGIYGGAHLNPAVTVGLATAGSFPTAPGIRSTPFNLIGEIIGTFVLVFGILSFGANTFTDGLNPLIVGFLVVSIGLSLGGTTGYAINPARDLGPRIAHAILPIKGKGTSDWGYSWIPVVGPIIGAVIAALVYGILVP